MNSQVAHSLGRMLLELAMVTSLVVARPAVADDVARPNFLFVIFDDWTWHHAGAYGCDWIETPIFDRVAKEGILFRNCFTSNPKSTPSRSCLLTGRSSWQLEEAICNSSLFRAKFAVYPDLLEAAGYFVGFTGKGWGPGDWAAGGFKRNPAGPSFDKHQLTPPFRGIKKDDYAANFADFLKAKPQGAPFSFWVGIHEPHRSFEEGSGLASGKKLEDVDVPLYLPDTPTVRSDLLDYAVEVEWGDRQVGRVLAELERSGQLDDTLIIITSENGMAFPRGNGQVYEDGFHLPLVARWGARIKPGRVVDDFIDVRDFAPTFLELAALGAHPEMTGKSMANVLFSHESGLVDPSRVVMLVGKERHDLGRPFDWGYPVRAIRTPEYFFSYNYFPDRWPAGNPETDYGNCNPSPTKEMIKRIGGYYHDVSFGKRPQRELYHLADDRWCLRNLATDPFYAPIAAELEARMLSMLRADHDPRALGNGQIFDTYPDIGKRDKGYETWLNAQDPPGAASQE